MPETKNPASALATIRGVLFFLASLLAQPEALDERAVSLDVLALEVIEQAAALAHEPQHGNP